MSTNVFQKIARQKIKFSCQPPPPSVCANAELPISSSLVSILQKKRERGGRKQRISTIEEGFKQKPRLLGGGGGDFLKFIALVFLN